MPYVEEVCKAGLTIEVSKYFTFRTHGKGVKRSPNMDKTPEAMRKNNQRRAGIRLRRLLNTNFQDGDYLVRLDFHKWKPIDSVEMQHMIATALRRLKRIYQQNGTALKYVYVKEVGSRGGRHIHMVINRIDTEIIRKWWEYGGIHIDPLNTQGQYERIAEYFIKYAYTTEKTEGKLIGKRWYASQNLQEPIIKKRIIKAETFKQNIKSKNGFYLDKSSVKGGISEITGYEYFSYTLIKRPQDDS